MAGSPLGWVVLEGLVGDWGVRRERNAIQIDDLAVHDELDIDRAFPMSADLASVLNRGFSCGWRVNTNTCARLLSQPEARAAPEHDGCSLTLDLQKVRPGRLKRFSRLEWDGVVQEWP